MPIIRNMISKVMPKAWAVEAEAESRQWVLRCELCGHEQGGMPPKAAGETRVRRTCPGCGKDGWHTIRRRED